MTHRPPMSLAPLCLARVFLARACLVPLRLLMRLLPRRQAGMTGSGLGAPAVLLAGVLSAGVVVPGLVALSAPKALAQTGSGQPLQAGFARALSEGEQQALMRVQDYLNSLTTVAAEFIQRSNSGAASGSFFWSRPRGDIRGGVRFNYEDPEPHFLTTSGGYVYFWDAHLETQSQDAIENTPAFFLMKPTIDLIRGDPDILPAGVALTAPGTAQERLLISLRQAADPTAGLLTLYFRLEPSVRLERWTVETAGGETTAVDLYNIREGVDIPQDVFIFARPDRGNALNRGPDR